MRIMPARVAEYATAAEMRAAHAARRAIINAAAWRPPAPPISAPAPRPPQIDQVPPSYYRMICPDWLDSLVDDNELLRSLFARGQPRGRSIAEAVAIFYEVPFPVFMSAQARGSTAIGRQRQVAMFLCDRELGYSRQQIASLFSRDRSTVWHAIRAVGRRAAKDATFALEVSAVTAKWQESCR